MENDLESRREKYFALSNRLAYLDNQRIHTLFGEEPVNGGWGRTHTIEVGGEKVFVKRIPLTDREVENAFSTANVYGLPTFYNYGVGSAGFGAFRELAAHVVTTNAVLAGEVANFPLMYHYRIVPFTGTHKELDPERHQKYIAYWNDDPNLDRYIRERGYGLF